MNKLKTTTYETSFSNGVITFKNINTTLGFARYNEEAEVDKFCNNDSCEIPGEELTSEN